MRYVIALLRPWQKNLIVIIHDNIMALFCFYLSFVLKFSEIFPSFFHNEKTFLITLIAIIFQGVSFYLAGMYKGIWRFSSTPDLIRVIKGTFFATISTIAVHRAFGENIYGPALMLINWPLLLVTLGGSRLMYRVWRDQFNFRKIPNDGDTPNQCIDNVLIVGGGAGGEQLIRDIKRNPSFHVNIAGIVDDDFSIRNKILHGVPVLGPVSDIPSIVKLKNVTKIFVAIPSASAKDLRKIVKVCENTKLEIKTLPKLSDILSGQIRFNQLRAVNPEDLLGRKEISLDESSIRPMIKGRKVLVTGAGGSIGSEICAQISRYSPEQIIFYEMTELFLYELEIKIHEKFPEVRFISVIGDVRNQAQLDTVFEKFRPDIVFHAAAYKHVPMMEKNPCEAIKTNIIGTKNVAEVAAKFKVDRFVMISTDKAVNPTNVMGASKRIAEMVCQHVQSKTQDTKFLTVRFGNVLGSSGSVIPLFKKQIENGGPVTVTHYDITRYFMSIAEAAQLVLQASAIGRGGEIFVLEMGEPFKIRNLAKQMITLAGLKVDEDIEIKYTGLRPGEKLYEELLADQETTLPTAHPKVRIAKARGVDKNFESELVTIIDTQITNLNQIKNLFRKLVPEYSEPTT